MVIKIKSNILRVFLKKTTVNGSIVDCKLRFTSNGLEMQHHNTQRNILVKGTLPKSMFDEYEEMDINIKNTETLLKSLDTFNNNDINIVKKDNMFKIMDANGGIDLAIGDTVECYNDNFKKIEYDNLFILEKDIIDTLIKRNSIIKSDLISLSIKNNNAMLSIGDNIDKANVNIPINIRNELSAKFEFKEFNDIFNQLDNNVSVKLSSDKPTLFNETLIDYTIEYYLMCVDEE